jgi:hypothetical protein
MCHNGVISFTLRQAIMNYLGEVWFEHHPSNWFGVYGDTGSFIDSELYTHYLVNSVLAADGESWQGLIAAYTREELMGVEPASYFLQARCSANMLFSDGTGLFAFRNTYLTSSQRLSWQNYGDMIGIKTRDAEANTLEQNELIKFCGGGEVVSEILEYEETEDFVPAADFYAQPNPFYGAVDIYYVPARSDDNENDEENGNADFVDIYNIRGRKIRSISSALQNNDYRTYHWDGFMDSGFRAPAGIYLYRHKRSGSAGKLVMYK